MALDTLTPSIRMIHTKNEVIVIFVVLMCRRTLVRGRRYKGVRAGGKVWAVEVDLYCEFHTWQGRKTMPRTLAQPPQPKDKESQVVRGGRMDPLPLPQGSR